MGVGFNYKKIFIEDIINAELANSQYRDQNNISDNIINQKF